MRSTGCTLLLAGVALASTASAQSFNYPDFTNTSGLVMNANTAQAGAVLRVTPSLAQQVGSVWRANPVVVDSGFDTTFTFQISALFSNGADGLVFVIHNDRHGTAAIGFTGYAMGYGGAAGTALQNSIAIEIDTWFNTGDLSDNEISVQTAGMGVNGTDGFYSIGHVTPVTNMSDGLAHTMRVRYTPGTLDIFLDNLSMPVLTVPWDFATGGTWMNNTQVPGMNLIGGSGAYVGFTGSTGGAWEDHDVLSWTWTSPLGPSAYCSAGTTTNGCSASISANTSPSVSMSAPCTVTVTNVEGLKSGILFYGIDNSGFSPGTWASGSTSLLCVKHPTQRTPIQSSGGTLNSCNGAFALAWDTFQTNHPTALGNPWSVGAKVYVQAWFRDPPAVKSTNLSDALEMTYAP
jgi:hypothetical protein